MAVLSTSVASAHRPACGVRYGLAIATAVSLAVPLMGCGQRGPLFLPDRGSAAKPPVASTPVVPATPVAASAPAR